LTPIAPRAGGAALFWVVAIACLLAAVAVLAALLANRSAQSAEAVLRNQFIARILEPESPNTLDDAALALNAIDGVDSVRIVTPERASALLRNWGGPKLEAADLPAMRLITFSTDRSPRADWTTTIASTMRGAGFTAEVYGPGPAAIESVRKAGELSDVTIAIGGVLFVAALLTAGLAGRARVAADRMLIRPLADMGATRGQVSRAFAGRAAVEGFTAGLMGAIAASLLAAWALSLPPFQSWASQLRTSDAAPLLVAPLIAALLAGAGARSASNRFFAHAARCP
jgi:cell division protein FtsX